MDGSSLVCTIMAILIVVWIVSTAAKGSQKKRISNLEREVYEMHLMQMKQNLNEDQKMWKE